MAYLDILFVLICILSLTRSSLGQEPDWSCNFDKNDDCGIVQGTEDGGSWKVKSRGGYYSADFDAGASIVDCTLPLDFQANSGNFSFRHYLKRGIIKLSFCEGGDYRKVEPIREEWTYFTTSFTCSRSSKMNISIRAEKVRSNPKVGIDDIEVFKDLVSTTAFPLTSRKSTSGITKSTLSVPTSDSTSLISSTDEHTSKPSSSSYQASTDAEPSTSGSSPGSSSQSSTYHTTTVTSSSISVTTSMTSPNHIRTTVSETPRTTETTVSFPETTLNSTVPYQENPRGVPVAVIASVSVLIIILLVVAPSIVLIVNRSHRAPQQNDSSGDTGKRSDEHVYANTAFSAKDDNMNQPDVISDAQLNKGLSTQHHSSYSTNSQGSLCYLQDDGNSKYGAEYSSVQGDHTDLKTPEGVVRQDEDAGQAYFVLERPGDTDNGGIQGTDDSFTDAKEQAYDHLNLGIINGNGQEEYQDIHYDAVAVMSDDVHYNTLVHGNEAVVNQRSSKDRTNLKNLVPDSGQDAGNEYQRLNLVDEKDSKPQENMEDNHYNVLGETDVDRMGNCGKTSTDNDTTYSEDNYSSVEPGDYHLYQCPEEVLNRGPTTNGTSKPQEDEDMYYYPVVGGQGTGMTEGDIKPNDEPSSQEEGGGYYTYATVQRQVATSGTFEDKQHEIINSSDIYSEVA